jgi:hypothetical protein
MKENPPRSDKILYGTVSAENMISRPKTLKSGLNFLARETNDINESKRHNSPPPPYNIAYFIE